MLDEMTLQNASKFAILYIPYKNPKFLFPFFAILLFFPMLTRVFMRGKNKVAQNEKRKKQLWVFAYIKYGKI